MSRPLDIAILELSLEQRSGTALPGLAMERVLRERGHRARRVGPPAGLWERLRAEERRSARSWLRRATGRPPLDALDALARHLAAMLRAERLDVVIARGIEVGCVFLHDVPGFKILDWPNIQYVEAYSSSESDLSRVDALFRRERAVLEASDLVISPGQHLTRFTEATVRVDGLVDKLVTVALGCEPTSHTAHFSAAPRMVYAGSYYPIQDPYLLSRLTALAPFPMDCYGPQQPPDAHLPGRLNYRGFAPDSAFLANYQVGVITLSRDRLREASPATKLAYYFAHGLPVLFPWWMKEGHDFPACAVPYDEATFAARALSLVRPGCWEEMSRSALQVGLNCTWEKTLTPLVSALELRLHANIIENHGEDQTLS